MPYDARPQPSPSMPSNFSSRSMRSSFGKEPKYEDAPIEFPCFSLLGGNRKDPLNLNSLIEAKQQLSNVHLHCKDHWVEIMLEPDICDPLCLDVSSHTQQMYNSTPAYSKQPSYTPKRRRRVSNYHRYRQSKPRWSLDRQTHESHWHMLNNPKSR